MTTIDLLKAIRTRQDEQDKPSDLKTAKERMQLMVDIGIITIAIGGQILIGNALKEIRK